MRLKRLCALSFLALPSSAEIICGPYVQMPTTSSMGIAWETANPSGGAVEYGLAGGKTSGRVRAPEGKTMHYVTLTGLKPGTDYRYQVTSDGQTSERWWFRTAPTRDQDVETRIVFWSDVQHGQKWVRADGGFKEGTPNNWIGAGKVMRGNLEQMMKFKPHLQFALGDIADRGDQADEWRHVINILKPLCATAPLMAVQGNHDSGGNLVMWRKYFHLPVNAPDKNAQELAYSFDYGNMRFIALSYSPGWKRYHGWIQKELKQARQRGLTWSFAGAHSFWEGGEIGDDILDLGLDFFFCGHSHSYHRSFPLVAADRLRHGTIAGASRDSYDGDSKGLIVVNTGTMGSYGGAAARCHNNLNVRAFSGNTRTFSRMTVKGNRIAFGTFDHTGKRHDAFTLDRDIPAGAPPAISNVQAVPLSGYSARITWRTDTGAFSGVEYALDSRPHAIKRTPVIQDLSREGGKRHATVLYALMPGSRYRFRVKNRRGSKWVESDWQTFATPKGKPGQLVCILNFSPITEYHIGGTWAASAEPYAPDIGFGWILRKGFSLRGQYGYNVREQPPKDLMELNPTGPEGHYRMARSRMRIANRDSVPFRLDLPDGEYRVTFCLGTLMNKYLGKVQVGDRSFLRKPWPDYEKHIRDWPFLARNKKVIRVKGDQWEGEDEWDADVSVTDGKLEFAAGAGDPSLEGAIRYYRGTSLHYAIVRKR